VPGLNIALQVLIDYKGFRMHCQAKLNIGKSTIKVGTADAGLTMHSSDNTLLMKMKRAAKELNIREHVVYGHTIYSACDVEGHLSEDGRLNQSDSTSGAESLD
jgi:hypothetical protein